MTLRLLGKSFDSSRLQVSQQQQIKTVYLGKCYRVEAFVDNLSKVDTEPCIQPPIHPVVIVRACCCQGVGERGKQRTDSDSRTQNPV